MQRKYVSWLCVALAMVAIAGCGGSGQVVVVGGDVGTGKVSAGATKWKAVGSHGTFDVEAFGVTFTPPPNPACPVSSLTLTVFKDRDRDGSQGPNDSLIGSYSATAIPNGNGGMQAGVAGFSYNPADDGPVMMTVRVCYGAPCEPHCVEIKTRLELKK